MSHQLSEEQLSKLKETIRKRIRELKNQLAEIEKFMGWYSKLKSETQLGKGDFFKRTENNIRKIKERIVRMANTIKEIDSDEEQGLEEVEGNKPKTLDKYVVTATPKGASKNAERRTITRPAPKNSAETQLKSLTKMDKYQSVRLKKA